MTARFLTPAVARSVTRQIAYVWIGGVARCIQRPDVLDPLLRWYWKMFDPDALAQFWHGRPTNDISEKHRVDQIIGEMPEIV